jgi:hypothetical protein
MRLLLLRTFCIEKEDGECVGDVKVEVSDFRAVRIFESTDFIRETLYPN